MKTSTQLKAQIRNLSKGNHINPQILMRNYMLERLLERIAHSRFKDNFILKGGMLVAAMVGVSLRATIDMDTTIKGLKLDQDSLLEIFQEILAIDISDGVSMFLKNIEAIRDEADYPGLRVSLEASMGTARIPLKVDLTTGDKITPKEILYAYKLMIENREIEVWAYNLETVLAEKLETIISRGVASTRMRDYYDLYVLLKMFSGQINEALLVSALEQTAEARGTAKELNRAAQVFDQIENDQGMADHWMRYQKSFSYARDIEWSAILPVTREMWLSIIEVEFG